MTSRPSSAAPLLAVLAIVAALLGAYVAGYFWLGEYREEMIPIDGEVSPVFRIYNGRWQCNVFAPLAAIEAKLRGGEVRLASRQAR